MHLGGDSDKCIGDKGPGKCTVRQYTRERSHTNAPERGFRQMHLRGEPDKCTGEGSQTSEPGRGVRQVNLGGESDK